MSYIRPENLFYHNDKVHALDHLRQLALNSQGGDERIRASILGKIEAMEADLASRVSETTLADGTVRVRHPSIGTVTFNQKLEMEPQQLFGSAVKALSTFNVEISLADAVISPDGVLTYEPYETLATFRLSETALSGMVTDIGGGSNPITIHSAKGYVIEPYVLDTMTNTAAKMREHLDNTLETTAARFEEFLADVDTELAKGGKLSKKTTEDLIREATNLPIGMANNPAFSLNCLGEYSDNVRMSAQLEIEAAIRLSQKKEIQ